MAIHGACRSEFVVTTRNGETWRWQLGVRACQQKHVPFVARQPPGARAADDTVPSVARQRDAERRGTCPHGETAWYAACYGTWTQKRVQEKHRLQEQERQQEQGRRRETGNSKSAYRNNGDSSSDNDSDNASNSDDDRDNDGRH